MNRGNILLIDDERQFRHLLKKVVSIEGFIVFETDSFKNVFRMLDNDHIEVILCDVNLPDGNGLEFIGQIKDKFPAVEIIMLTAFGAITDGVKSIQFGAFDYLTKGDDQERIIPTLDRAVEKYRLRTRIIDLEKRVEKRFTFDTILGKSDAIKQAVAMALRVSPTDATVLLLGETGTGKEVFAQAIHQASKRVGHPFIALNVSSFGRDLLESELFGHLAGAFTSALKNKKGLLEEANGGTLFLDEIGEMAVDLQAKLLRVLETGEFIKLGDTKSTKVSVRIVTATNRDLENEVRGGKFREDLFYRLNTFTIMLPSLGDRKDDIAILALHFLHIYALKSDKQVVGMNKNFLQQLHDHKWRGNIRELKNIIERAVILSDTSELTPENLPFDFQVSQSQTHFISAFALASAEKLHIQRILNHTNGNKAAAAKLLDIGLTTLYRKIEEYGLDK